jgi:hypothetical protein
MTIPSTVKRDALQPFISSRKILSTYILKHEGENYIPVSYFFCGNGVNDFVLCYSLHPCVKYSFSALIGIKGMS